MNGTTLLWVSVIGGVLLIVGTLATWMKVGRRSAKKVEAVSDAILGRAEVLDRSGAVIQEAQPGMPAQVKALTEAVAELVNLTNRLDATDKSVAEVRADLSVVKKDVQTLKDARLEHVVTRVESAQAFAAIEAVAKAQPED